LNPRLKFFVVDKGDEILVNKADFVFSFAVFKHIGSLSHYESALGYFCNLAKVGGSLALNLYIQDYYDKESSRETNNFENFSIRSDFSDFHKQDTNWSGVYISRRWIEVFLRTQGVVIKQAYQHNTKVKPGNMWLICEKVSTALEPES